MTTQIIRVGLGVICMNGQGQFMMGRRKNAHGDGTWALPGGHLEFGETFEQCAAREVLEETGLELTDIKTLSVANHFFDDGAKHYVTLYCIGRINGDPRVMEPHKTESWEFFSDWSNLPQPCFVPYNRDVRAGDIEAYLQK